MKNPVEFLFISAVGWLVLILAVYFRFHSKAQTSSIRIQWFDDAVYYTTNSMVPDREKNKTLATNSIFYYYKDEITTNKGTWFHLFMGENRLVEFGGREDGVVVWRYVK